ncbi:MAG: nickel pincer cofactor biosynthesis protein LarB, partial [Eubacteriales bacterium]
MNRDELKQLLESVQSRETDIEDAMKKLVDLPQKELGYATLDSHREIRVGVPEVIYCAGKTVEQVCGIVQSMIESGNDVLGTRATEEMYNAVLAICPDAQFNALGRTITVQRHEKKCPEGTIVIVCAGTSDLPVVEEAYETARILGNKVEKIVDVGVAGIHRLFNKLDRIRSARVVIVVAGMEGALASVVAGLVDKPVIAVPTSVGYGASFGGIAA